MNEPCQIWICHVTHTDAMAYPTYLVTYKISWERVCQDSFQMNEPCHVWMSHVTCEWVTSYMNESRHIWTSHITYRWAMSHMNEQCHIYMSHVTHEWVMSRMKALILCPTKRSERVCAVTHFRMCATTHFCVCHDSFICATWLIHMCDICEGTARPAASTTLLRLGTRPSGNLPTQRHSSTSSQHDHPAPRDTPFGEPKLCFWNNIFWTIDLPSTLVLCPSILQHYFVEAFIVIHKN